MKRAAVKRMKANSGAKRNAPRRRSSAKSKTSKTHTATPKAKSRVKVKTGTNQRKTVSRRSARRTRTPSAAIMNAPTSTALESEPTAPSKAKQSSLEIPPILLEGDEPESPATSGPGEKFSLGPETATAHFTTAPTHLPTSYGTGRLFLAPRDPHWIYAYWDINPILQFQHNARSVDRHMILRMHERDLSNKPVAEIHVHPESRHWFAHVERAGEQYVADLGYYQPGRKWKSLATSRMVRTPPDSISGDAQVEFATIPPEVPFATMLSLVQEGEERTLPLAHAIEQLRDRRMREFPPAPPPTVWTSEQERALAEILATGRARRALLGSHELSGLPLEGSPADLGSLNLPSSLEEYLSSPLGGGEQAPPDFWLKVNAELTIYGSSQPNAHVSMGGKQILLQPDGSFSIRFALPDGQFEMPLVAVSADGTDARAAELKFSRATNVFGDVGTQKQDPTLQPPTAQALPEA